MIRKKATRRGDMDSVRFNIIESNLRWKSRKESLISLDEEDRKSISSESSGDCDGIPLILPTDAAQAKRLRTEDERWNNSEIECIIKDVPDSAGVMTILNSTDLSGLQDANVNTAILMAVLIGRHDIVMRLIHEHHANANASDLMGRTALHLACLTANQSIGQLLIINGADVNRWDKSKLATPLHFAAQAKSVECIQLLLRRGANVNAGIEKRSALHVAVEKRALKCVEALLRNGANPNTPQVYTETPLHTAATLGDLECLQLLLQYGSDVRSQSGRSRTTALHLAAENDYAQCARALLENGAVVDARNFAQQTPLHLACLSQCAETVELLLKHNADVNAIYKDGRTALHASIVKEAKCNECAKLLLVAGIDVNRSDNYGYTPLHIAALNEMSSCTNMLIEYGADITARTKGGVSALSFIVRRTPEVIPIFLSKFDACITVNEHEIGDVDCEVKLDFRLLVPNTDRGETELLLAFIEVGKRRILKHPLCEIFLFLKWRRIRKFFLFSLFFHAMYVLLFTIYVLGVFDKDCGDTEGEDNLAGMCQVPSYVPTVGYLAIMMNCIMLAKEFFQMAHGFASYVKYWENWVQWSIVIGVFLCTTPSALTLSNLNSVPVWQHHVAAIVIFLVWLELMMLVGRFPIFGLYVQMFTKVAVNFAKFLMAYCCLLIAFGLSFGVLFSNYVSFKFVPWTMLKMITMMSGELEFEDIFYGDQTKILYPVTAHAMFFTFVLLVTVILTNLLVGLAVSDIQGLQASAGLDRLCRQAELVARLEGLFFSKLLRKTPRELILLCQRSALLRTSRHNLQFCVRPNDPRDTRLPKDMVVSVYKLVAERRDRNQSLRHKKREHSDNFLRSTMDESLRGVQLRNKNSSNTKPGYSSISSTVTSPSVRSKDLDYETHMDALKVQMYNIGNKLSELQSQLVTKVDRIELQMNNIQSNHQHRRLSI